MTVYNKLKIAILAVLTSQSIHAINVDPVQVQSAPGELLYAEMHFRQSDPNKPIEVSLASAEDLTSMGASHQPPGNLNFYTRRNHNGTGVITITSTRPLVQSELNIIVKIQEGNAARLQHIKTPLKRKTDLLQAKLSQNERPLAPIVVVSEKDIALNLPVSMHHSVQTAKKPQVQEQPLAIKRSTPPALSSSSIPQMNVAQVTPPTPKQITPQPIASVNTAQTASTQIAPAIPPQQAQPVNTMPTTPTSTAQPVEPKPLATIQPESNPISAQATPVELPKAPVTATTNQEQKLNQFTTQNVQPTIATESSDPLVKAFAEQQALAKAQQEQTQQNAQQQAPEAIQATIKPVQAPQKVQTKTTSTNYVVQSNESLWKIASQIANEQQRPVTEVMQNIKQANEHAFISGDANRLRRGATLNLDRAIPSKAPIKVSAQPKNTAPQRPAPKTKYRLNQAEMSLVAESKQDSNRISANQATQANRTSKELSLKVMTAREKTVRLQRNVTDLELALNQKDHRIQLLNARLAQLQQQLKAKQAEKQPIPQ